MDFLKNYVVIKQDKNGTNTSYFSNSFTNEKSLMNLEIFDKLLKKYQDVLLENKEFFVKNINLEVLKGFNFLNNYTKLMEETSAKLEKEILMDINKTGLKNTEKRRL